jgi:hypothetical protein
VRLLALAALVQASTAGVGRRSLEGAPACYPRGKEYFTFSELDLGSGPGDAHIMTPVSAAGPPVPFEPMRSPPSAAPSALPFLFIHQPKSAGTSIRKVGWWARVPS